MKVSQWMYMFESNRFTLRWPTYWSLFSRLLPLLFPCEIPSWPPQLLTCVWCWLYFNNFRYKTSHPLFFKFYFYVFLVSTRNRRNELKKYRKNIVSSGAYFQIGKSATSRHLYICFRVLKFILPNKEIKLEVLEAQEETTHL